MISGSFVSAGMSRTSGLPLAALAVLVTMAALICIGAEHGEARPSADEPDPVLFSMEFQNVPTTMMFYPTRGWSANVAIPGVIMVENYRPDEVMVLFNASIDCDWFTSIEPVMMRFDTTRYDMRNFKVYLHIPPNTFGPSEATVTIRATATTGIRDLGEIQAEVVITLLNDVDQVIEGLSTFFIVHDEDRVFSGRVRLYNMLDVPQEFHISAMGDWESRLPDLDLQGTVVLNPQEQRDATLIGHLRDGLKPGEYRVDLALWTPNDDGGRIYILNKTVDMELISIKEDAVSTILRAGVPLVILMSAVTGTAVYLVLRRRHRRRLDDLQRRYEGWDRNEAHFEL